MPIVPDVRDKRRNRPRTHHSRSRSKTRYEVKPRPKTTRCYAPISYTNLSICYDSGGSSDEGGFSPTRPIAPGSSHFSGYRNYRRAVLSSVAHAHDQFSLLTIKSAKFDNLNFSNDTRGLSPSKIPNSTEKARKLGSAYEPTFNVPPKPYLSIIDLNQLTRGSLNMKSTSFDG